MDTRQTMRCNPGKRAVTLVEVMVSVAILCLVSVGAIQTIQLSKLTSRQAYENSIAMAFLEDYLENVLGLTFTEIALTGSRTIYLLDGLRTLPPAYSANTWYSLNTTANLQAFPELANLIKGSTPVSPEYQVAIQHVDETLNGSGGGAGADYKIVTVRIRWPGARFFRDASARSQLELEARRYISDVRYMDRHI